MSAIELTEEQLAERALCPGVPRDASQIAAEISARHCMPIKSIMGPSRHKSVMRARRDLYRAMRNIGWSYPEIGRFVGGRDHTTVMSALSQKGWPADDPDTKRWVAYRRKVKAATGKTIRNHWLRDAGPYVDGLLDAAHAEWARVARWDAAF
jgi:hypothetical protein